MESKMHGTESSSPRAKVWASLVITTLGAVASLIAALVRAGEFLELPKAIVAAIVAIVASAAFTLVLARRERGPSRLGKLKDDLANAYLGALDRSPLNPLRRGPR